MKLIELASQQILILGLGKEGLSTLKFLRRLLPEQTLGIADRAEFHQLPKNVQTLLQNDSRVKLYLSTGYLDACFKHAVVIKTPGISPYQTDIQKALKQGIVFTSQTELFLDNFSGQVIGVTGTKGKSTTAALTYHLLKSAGMDVALGGNIGRPCLELLARNPHYAVLELSSHQLWNIRKSPHIAVFLNLFAEHLDYSDFAAYFSAKKNIIRWQSANDHFVLNGNVPRLLQLTNTTTAHKWVFGKSLIDYPCCFMSNGALYYQAPEKTPEKIIPLSALPLPGPANQELVQAAILVAKIIGTNTQQIKTALTSFKPLPGRLEKVGVFKTIIFYEDVLATIPEATLNALKTFTGNVGCLFLGGYERKQNYTQVLAEIMIQKIPLVILFPPNGERIKQQLLTTYHTNLPQIYLVDGMKAAVELSLQHTPQNTLAVFSTGAPSFGMFKSYRHRSRRFRYWLKKLSQS